MAHDTKPLLRDYVLIIVGCLFIVGVMVFGLLSDPGEIIRKDVRFGPAVAAIRIIIPIFVVIGALFLLANIKKCKNCGKILFWRKPHSD